MTTSFAALALVDRAAAARVPPVSRTVEASMPRPHDGMITQRKPTCACGGGCPQCAAQNAAGFLKESHSSQFIEAFTERPVAPPLGTILRRKCACEGGGDDCERCRAESIMRRKAGESFTGTVPAIVHEVLSSPGRPLDFSTRTFMESQLGHDFSAVRVHDDARAARSAQAVAASAYTVGTHVAFEEGQYNPGTFQGRKLLAHELTHVMQGAGPAGGAPGQLKIGEPESAEERHADEVADRIAGPSGLHHAGSLAPSPATVLRRQPAPAAKPLCDPTQIAYLNKLANKASEDILTPAIDKLSDFGTGDPVNDPMARSRDEAVSLTLSRCFSLKKGDKRISDVRRTLESIKEIINRLSSKTQVCPPKEEYGNCSAASAYVTDMQEITYCPKFMSEDIDSQYNDLIHEIAHTSNSSIKDRGYSHQRIFTLLSTAEALINADSYSRLAMELFDRARGKDEGTRSFAAFEFQVDKFQGCDKVDSDLLFKGLALAEKYNEDAGLDISGEPDEDIKDPSEKELHKKDKNYYATARKDLFSKSLTFKCLATKDEECTQAYLRYNNFVFTFCPKEKRPTGPPEAAFWMLQQIYDAIAGGPGNFSAWHAALHAPQRSATVTPPLAAPAPAPAAPGATASPAAAPKAAPTRKPKKRGDKGWPISELQEKLQTITPSLKISGAFDTATEQAVKSFQTSHGLGDSKKGASGVVDDATWASLHAAVPGDHGLPTGEKFIARGWRSGIASTILDWDQQLLPDTVDFTGMEVKEVDPGGGVNSCCQTGLPCMTKITGGTWTVRPGSQPPKGAKAVKGSAYGPDAVGLIEGVVRKTRDFRLAPCGYTIPQRMVVIRPEGDVKYVENKLIYKIEKDQVICMKTNADDTQSETRKKD